MVQVCSIWRSTLYRFVLCSVQRSTTCKLCCALYGVVVAHLTLLFHKTQECGGFFLLDRIPFRTWYMHGAAAIGLIALDMRTHQDIYFWGVTKPVIIYKTIEVALLALLN